MSEEPNCPSCGWRSYARIDQQIADGSFAPGPYVRCIQCKREWMLPLPPPPDAGEVRTYRDGVESEWQEIETAPKDGDEILLLWGDGAHSQVVASWDDERTDDYRWLVMDSHHYHKDAFSHWRPLPAPPAAAIRKLP